LEIRLKDKLARHYRFHVSPDDLKKSGEVRFSRRESRHMLASLRVSAGDLVSATDGKGTVHRVLVEGAAGPEVTGMVQSSEHIDRTEPLIHLFQALVRPVRMELIAEKATELGVWGITPVRTSRSKGSMGPARLGRLRRAAIEAMKQSLGAYIPEVTGSLSIEEALEISAGLGLILVADSGQNLPTLPEVLKGYRGGGIGLWIGPEGGFSASETRALEQGGAVPYTLGRSRLKSETAAIASVAVVRSLAGA
jgi:16S rRNA (uracil1498-N3)-methyltransferase